MSSTPHCIYSYILIFNPLKVSLAATDSIVFALDFIRLTLDRVLRQAAVMNHWVVHNDTNSLTRWTTTSFPIRILHYGPQKIFFNIFKSRHLWESVSIFIFWLLIRWNLPLTEPQGTGIFFRCRNFPFTTGTSILVLGKADRWACKRFPLKTVLRYAQVPFQRSSLY